LIVVDASLFVAWLLNEPLRTREEAVWDLLSTETVLAPAHWPNEIANALRRAVRTRRLSADEIVSIAEEVGTFDIGFAEPTSIEAIASLAKDALHYDLSAYDMVYVNLAREHRLPLATIDQAMRAAAQRLDIQLLPA
jgi:predicted nucleic acid-binding protein